MKIIGILNLTSNSFSDGNVCNNTAKAIFHAEYMYLDGAEIIDIGAESTRPGSFSILHEDELQKVLSVIRALRLRGIPTSIDTRNTITALECLNAGSIWLNDVSALTYDLRMYIIARYFQVVIIMHNIGSPKLMQKIVHYSKPLEASFENFFKNQLENSTLCYKQALLDPGIGFAKHYYDNLQIFNCLDQLRQLAPLLLGYSRKNFIGKLIHENCPNATDFATIGVTMKVFHYSVNYTRVHNVKAVINALIGFNFSI